jgi:uncharacterized protein (DUF2141 family)
MIFDSMRIIRVLPLLVMIAVGQTAFAENIPGILTVEVSGLKDESGDIYIAVYNSDSTWLSDKTVMVKGLDIDEALEGDLVRTELELPLGEYALSVFYDRNGNGEMDTNFIGMPKEPIAVSNDAVAKFGPPKYEDAVFSLGIEPVIQHISIKDL